MQLVTASTYSDQVTIAHIVICVLLQSRVYKLNKKGQSIYMRNLFVLTICQLEKKKNLQTHGSSNPIMRFVQKILYFGMPDFLRMVAMLPI